MKKILIIIPALFFLIPVYSQVVADNLLFNTAKTSPEEEGRFVFEARYIMEELNKELQSLDEGMVRNHLLGNDISKRLYFLEERYTGTTDAAPGSFSGHKITQKPIIYNSTYKMVKYFRKKVKKGILDKQTASEELRQYLDIALILLYENTGSLENALKETDSEEGIINVFRSVRIQ